MSYRATITLDEEAYRFLMSAARENRSGFINTLLKKERDRELEAAILEANREEALDTEYREETALWDQTLADGI
ncbi:MAG: CopG family transcriptional regulator [Lewinellaceae bacterium]|nr:CopG family transcriptional regulator [Lewinellaceae bacterium]